MNLRGFGLLLVVGLSASCGGGSDESDPTGHQTPDVGGPGDTESFGETHDGIATYYAATGEGACLFDASPDNLMVAAINAEQWENSAWCGACVDITGPIGQVRVRIVDLCPECETGHLDLSPDAFEQIADLELGRVDISWQMVACAIDVPISYRYKDGANQWWTAVQVLDHRLPIASMEYSKDGASFSPMMRMDYNYFLTESGFGEGETTVRVTAIDGQTLTDVLPPVEEYLITEGQAQFAE
jgi:expansin (peptidoglycan-binding protein)